MTATGQLLTYAGVTLDDTAGAATRGGRDLHLSRVQFDMLHLFLANPHVVLTHQRIAEAVWGYQTDRGRLSEVILRLRTKMEADGEPRLIHSVRGLGYILREAP